MVLIAVCLLLVRFFSGRLSVNTDGGFVTTQDFPELFSALKCSGANGAFFVVLIPGTARNDGFTANLQYSIDGGVVGLDWVLIAKRNIEDQERFQSFIRNSGASVEIKESNGVRFLRVTDSQDIIGLGRDFLIQVYGVKPIDKLQLIITNFKWKKSISGK